MSITIFAGITLQGTAAGETALCSDHNTPENIEHFYADDVIRREECTENVALECQFCGVIA